MHKIGIITKITLFGHSLSLMVQVQRILQEIHKNKKIIYSNSY